MPRGIAFADRILVADSADNRRAGPFDQLRRIEPFPGVAFEIAERRVVPRGEPGAEAAFAFGQMPARRKSAEVEPDSRRCQSYRIVREHFFPFFVCEFHPS